MGRGLRYGHFSTAATTKQHSSRNVNAIPPPLGRKWVLCRLPSVQGDVGQRRPYFFFSGLTSRPPTTYLPKQSMLICSQLVRGRKGGGRLGTLNSQAGVGGGTNETVEPWSRHRIIHVGTFFVGQIEKKRKGGRGRFGFDGLERRWPKKSQDASKKGGLLLPSSFNRVRRRRGRAKEHVSVSSSFLVPLYLASNGINVRGWRGDRFRDHKPKRLEKGTEWNALCACLLSSPARHGFDSANCTFSPRPVSRYTQAGMGGRGRRNCSINFLTCVSISA